MKKITDKRNALQIAEQLSAIARGVELAGVKRRIYAAAQGIRREYGFTQQEKQRVVFDKLMIGAVTIRDLIDETGFTRNDIEQILQQLEKNRRIRFLSFSGGSPGRPQTMIEVLD